jgi:hypothetical protein
LVRYGRFGFGSARSGAPTWLGTGSPALPPMPNAATSLTSNCHSPQRPAVRIGPRARGTGLRNLPMVYPEPAVMRDRPPGLRIFCLDRDARLDGHARWWESNRLRARPCSEAGTSPVAPAHAARQAGSWPWSALITTAISRRKALAPGRPARTIPTTRRPADRGLRSPGATTGPQPHGRMLKISNRP